MSGYTYADAETYGQTGAEMLANPRDTIQEALREYVGDGEGLEEEVLDRHDAKVRAEALREFAGYLNDAMRRGMVDPVKFAELSAVRIEKEAGA